MKGVSKLRRRGGRMEWKERKEGSEILERERESKKKLPTCVYLQRDLFSLKKFFLHIIICLK